MTWDKSAPARFDRVGLPERREIFGASVAELDRELSATPQADGGLDFTHGDPVAFPPPEWALPQLSNAIKRGDGAYTPYRGNPQVLAAVAPRVGTLLGMPVDPASEAIVTPGSQAALFTVLSSLVGPGDVVLLPDPEYFASEKILRYLGAEVVAIPLTVDDDGNGKLDFDVMQAALRRRPKLLLFSHPNNPTGRTYGPAVIDRIAEFALANDIFVVVDQLYCRLVYEGKSFEHIASRPGMKGQTATLLGPSKTESMSGYRLGVAVAPAELVDRMEQVVAIACLRTPGYNQHLLRYWMADDADWLTERIRKHQELRDLVVAKFKVIDGLEVASPLGSSYVFPDVSALGINDHDLASRLKREVGVLVSPGYQFGARGAGHFRINFSQDSAALAAALDRLCDVITSLQR